MVIIFKSVHTIKLINYLCQGRTETAGEVNHKKKNKKNLTIIYY